MGSLSWLPSCLEQRYSSLPTIVKVGPIEEADHGFVSTIYRVDLSWTEDGVGPSSVVVKVPGTSKAEENFSKNLQDEKGVPQMELTNEDLINFAKNIHQTESAVYGLFLDQPAPFPIPHSIASFEFSSPHPAIVMEDVIEAKTVDIVKGFNEAQVFSIVDSIVQLHVYSFSHSEWRSLPLKVHENFAGPCKMLIDVIAPALIKKNPKEMESIAYVHEMVGTDTTWFTDYLQKIDKYPSVIVHGDMWCPQFLWRKNKLVSIVDWQLCHAGSLTEDLLHLLSLCVSSSLRIRLTPRILDYYYKEMKEKLSKKGIEMPFTYDDLLTDYNQTLPYISVLALFSFSFWCNSPVLRRETDEDEENVAEILSRVVSISSEMVNTRK